MSDHEQKNTEQVARSFNKQLNSHGFSFQHRVIKEAGDLAAKGKSTWHFEAAEVPVTVRGEDTRIDFILRRHPGLPFYLLAECKRSNPALSNWCFARAPYVHRRRVAEYEPLMLERMTRYNSQFKSYAFPRSTAKNVCHIAIDVKSSQTGDQHDSGRGAIEKAASQIMRGLNGLIDLLPAHPEILGPHPAVFFPVIFTTATLWLSDVDLSRSDLRTGEIDLTGYGFARAPWVLYQYHLSPGIKHSQWKGNSPDDISSLMDLDYIRTIAIVSPDGVEDFFRWSSLLDIDV